MKSLNFSLVVLEAEMFKVEVPAWPGLVRTHVRGAEFPWCPRLVESRGRESAAPSS